MKSILVLISFFAFAQLSVGQNEFEYKSPLDKPRYQEIVRKFYFERIRNRGSRITGGVNAQLGDFPYQTLNFMDDSYICGGSILSEGWVMTAGHCLIEFTKVEVNAGINYVWSYGIFVDFITGADNLIIHENYNDTTLTNDIGLIRTTRPIEFGAYINAIPLLPRMYKDSNFFGELATVTGFGTSSDASTAIDYLKSVQSPIGTSTWCAHYWGDYVESTNICMETYGGKSFCNGDSGSAMTLNLDTKTYAAGIVSFSAKLCEAGYPAVYTRIASYVDWIQNATAIVVE